MSRETEVAARPNRGAGGGLLAWSLGLGLTVAFYAALPYVPYNQAELQRYFTAHWIEYATTGLFFIGMCTLAVKLRHSPTERAALNGDLLDGLTVDHSLNSGERARALETHLRLVARRCSESQLVRRLQNVCDYVRVRRNADGLEGHLNYLAEIASGRLHDSYALIRTITWAIPILGFLGTVIGITMAIANVTPDQLSSSLNEVTAGLAVAFDTTALSLGLSMVLVFATFLVERIEQQSLDAVEDLTLRHMLAYFPGDAEQPASPWLVAEQQAAEQLLARTDAAITHQTGLWQSALEELRGRWTDTLQREQGSLEQSLRQGVAQTLDSHSEQLDGLRQEIVAAYAATAERIQQHWSTLESAAAERRAVELKELLTELRQQQEQSGRQAAEQSQQLGSAVETLVSAIGAWQIRLEEATFATERQMGALDRQGEVLLQLRGSEDDLVRVERQLAENLQTVRTVDTLQETVLNLNAAVNLLAARGMSRAA
ncbi:MotA/TolQ/ExbB proton channel family protein [Planctellipticum variicoloris]|uniref:MotA/TolQ/ExbB proton channel family protein n=1 Tax=Planctellipticum variicoloris TaxID=3064265 RepID=UPI00301411DE|nr:MotA/TolQ/ExbB proton channel family protein [Planctomycetaceae bacterium SH412]